LAYSKDGVLLEDKLGEESKDGLHRIAHFHPKRAHNAGVVDGTITDYVGVWKHKLVA
jgi:hypothetical protein